MSLKLKKQKNSSLKKIINYPLDYLHEEKIKAFVKKEKLEKELPDTEDKKKREKILKDLKTLPEETMQNYLLKTCDIIREYYELKEQLTVIDLTKNINSQIKILLEKQKLLESEYYSICGIDFVLESSNIASNKQDNICENCNSDNIVLNYDSFYTCQSCGLTKDMIVTGASFKQIQETERTEKFVYQRINYFNDWVKQLQGFENVDIPDELLENIKAELIKRNIKDSSKLKPSLIKNILKQLGNSKYYENIQLIISKLTKKPRLVISQNACQKLNQMFIKIQKPYERLKGNRVNFFSYSYILYKFCELLNLKECLPHIQLLKNRDNLMKHDILWKKIILSIQSQEGNSFWKYIPSC